MIKKNLVTFSIQRKSLYDTSYIIISSIALNEGTDMKTTIDYINQKYSKKVYSFLS